MSFANSGSSGRGKPFETNVRVTRQRKASASGSRDRPPYPRRGGAAAGVRDVMSAVRSRSEDRAGALPWFEQ